MKVTVPFEFAVGNKMLPAGEYQISHEGGSLRIQNRNTKTGLYVIPNPGTPRSTGSLAFALNT